jgi:hypothetical protein
MQQRGGVTGCVPLCDLCDLTLIAFVPDSEKCPDLSPVRRFPSPIPMGEGQVRAAFAARPFESRPIKKSVRT